MLGLKGTQTESRTYVNEIHVHSISFFHLTGRGPGRAAWDQIGRCWSVVALLGRVGLIPFCAAAAAAVLSLI